MVSNSSKKKCIFSPFFLLLCNSDRRDLIFFLNKTNDMFFCSSLTKCRHTQLILLITGKYTTIYEKQGDNEAPALNHRRLWRYWQTCLYLKHSGVWDWATDSREIGLFLDGICKFTVQGLVWSLPLCRCDWKAAFLSSWARPSPWSVFTMELCMLNNKVTKRSVDEIHVVHHIRASNYALVMCEISLPLFIKYLP